MQRVLPAAAIKARIGAIAIGLAIDCDDGDPAISQFFHSHLGDATTLPFAAFLTSDGQWIDGFSGFLDEKRFGAMLEAAAKSPLLQATPAVQQQLAKAAATANDAVAKGDWKIVLKVAREAAATTGRCAERDAIRAAEQQARDWVAAQFAAIVDDAQTGKDLGAARQRLQDVKQRFAGEPEVADAELGTKAILRLQQIRAAEARGNAAKDLRSKAAAQYVKTRWEAAFAVAAAASAAPTDGK